MELDFKLAFKDIEGSLNRMVAEGIYGCLGSHGFWHSCGLLENSSHGLQVKNQGFITGTKLNDFLNGKKQSYFL